MEKYRKDFPILKKDVIFFDNGAGSLKPQQVIDAVTKYYTEHNGNPHSADYPMGRSTVDIVEKARIDIAKFIGANSQNQIFFTSGTTYGLNAVINGVKHLLKDGDKIAMTHFEHASMLLPMFELDREIKYFHPERFDINDFKDVKIFGLISSSNVIGNHFDCKNVIKQIRSVNPDAIIIVDGAQHVPHFPIDVKDMDCDYLVASGHKMLAPSGTGFVYAKQIEKLEPFVVGGGMNIKINSDGTYTKKSGPHLHEAGTQNGAGIYGLGRAINYLTDVGMEKIAAYEQELRDYLIEKLREVENIILYGCSKQGAATISFNIDGCHPHDIVYYMGQRNICLRAGNHCAKLLKEEIGVDYSVRASLAFYNTKQEIDKFVKILKEAGGDFLEGII